LTQRLLTADELADARAAYNAIGRLYEPTGVANELVIAAHYLNQVITHNTTDGKPLRTERPPTAADIGKRVKVRDSDTCRWGGGYVFCGFNGERFVTVVTYLRRFEDWKYCIIDEEAAQ
jgi:hypothetical protein